jgi:hypothetical protein
MEWNEHSIHQLSAVIPRKSGESSTPQRLGLLDRPLSRAMTPQEVRQIKPRSNSAPAIS